jgi:hypothetical protein
LATQKSLSFHKLPFPLSDSHVTCASLKATFATSEAERPLHAAKSLEEELLASPLEQCRDAACCETDSDLNNLSAVCCLDSTLNNVSSLSSMPCQDMLPASSFHSAAVEMDSSSKGDQPPLPSNADSRQVI